MKPTTHPGCSRRATGSRQFQQMTPIRRILHGPGEGTELPGTDVAPPESDFLRAGNALSLPLFQSAYEIGRIDQGFGRTHVQPCMAATETDHFQISTFEVGVVDIGNFQFSTP